LQQGVGTLLAPAPDPGPGPDPAAARPSPQPVRRGSARGQEHAARRLLHWRHQGARVEGNGDGAWPTAGAVSQRWGSAACSGAGVGLGLAGAAASARQPLALAFWCLVSPLRRLSPTTLRHHDPTDLAAVHPRVPAAAGAQGQVAAAAARHHRRREARPGVCAQGHHGVGGGGAGGRGGGRGKHGGGGRACCSHPRASHCHPSLRTP
jgi:hypothetical protein